MNPIITRDGLTLHHRLWPHPAPKSQVLIVHGLGEHGGRYAALAERLVAAGHAVAAYDQRGHGQSPERRGCVPQADSLCDDLAQAIDAWPRQAPLVLLGHSMGGLVAARFVAENLVARPAAWARPPERVDRLVLSSPALDAGLGGGQKALLALMSRLAPGVLLGNGLQPAWISRDPAVVQAYRQDPLVHDRICARLVRFIVDGGERVRTLAPFWRTPTLLMWAGADRCVAPAGSAAFAAAAPAAVLQQQVWPGLAHEIFNEPERDAVIDRLVQFL
ncbi:MAG: alpha/beta hydrolase [Proteobacteria bacterium]|nr:alpha/beta hydrolase [Pseudomonadota bacterium]